jgi:hypothetical protein
VRFRDSFRLPDLVAIGRQSVRAVKACKSVRRPTACADPRRNVARLATGPA